MYLARCGPHIVHDGLSHDLQNTREKQTSAPLPSYLTCGVDACKQTPSTEATAQAQSATLDTPQGQ